MRWGTARTPGPPGGGHAGAPERPDSTWWQATDGRFYPPHLHPNAPRRAPLAPPPARPVQPTSAVTPSAPTAPRPSPARPAPSRPRSGAGRRSGSRVEVDSWGKAISVIVGVVLAVGAIGVEQWWGGGDDAVITPPTIDDPQQALEDIFEDMERGLAMVPDAGPVDEAAARPVVTTDFATPGDWFVGTIGGADTSIEDGGYTVRTASPEWVDLDAPFADDTARQISVAATGSSTNADGGIGVRCSRGTDAWGVLVVGDRWQVAYTGSGVVDPATADPHEGALPPAVPGPDGASARRIRIVCANSRGSLLGGGPSHDARVLAEIDGVVVADESFDLLGEPPWRASLLAAGVGNTSTFRSFALSVSKD